MRSAASLLHRRVKRLVRTTTDLAVAKDDSFLLALLFGRLDGKLLDTLDQLSAKLVLAVEREDGETTELGKTDRQTDRQTNTQDAPIGRQGRCADGSERSVMDLRSEAGSEMQDKTSHLPLRQIDTNGPNGERGPG